MKKAIFIVLLFSTLLLFGQKNEFHLIKLDSTWGQEVLRFPARNMNYVGVGEVRFPPKGWINPEHQNFWSYTYAWSINADKNISAEELSSDLIKYFNSLNKVAMDDEDNYRKSNAIIKRIKKRKSISFYEGKATIFDRFATNVKLILNVKIESYFCKQTHKTVLLFKFSPKEFQHKTWQMLNKIKLIKPICK